MTTATPAHTLTVRSPEDVLAAVPVLLGFHPNDSLVMLTATRAGRAFQARIDLPTGGDDDRDATIAALMDPAREHGVERVVLVAYDGDLTEIGALLASAEAAFSAAGIRVAAMLAVQGRQWFPVEPGVPLRRTDGMPFDPSAHAFTAQAVLDGRLVRESRAALAESLASDPERVAAVAAARAGSGPAAFIVGADSSWVTKTVAAHLASGRPPDDQATARLLAGLAQSRVRDAVLRQIRGRGAADQLEFWSDLVRRAPDRRVASVAAMLGFAAWQAGHGALAWCAVDRCLAAEPDHPLGRLVAEALERAVPPES